jgi:hypothetical protein
VRFRSGDEVSPDEVADTVLHELMHLVMLASDIEHRMPTQRQAETAEALVSGMTPILLDALRRNPELVRYLCEEVPDGPQETKEKA